MTRIACINVKYKKGASMRPRLIAVDDAFDGVARGDDEVASMRPRLIAVDDAAIYIWRTAAEVKLQ